MSTVVEYTMSMYLMVGRAGLTAAAEPDALREHAEHRHLGMAMQQQHRLSQSAEMPAAALVRGL